MEFRDFKHIYLRKRNISNLCKPVTCNAFISDPDDVCTIMVTVLFQVSLNNVSDFIATVKEAIRTIREDLDVEVNEDEPEDQVEFSIPHQKLKSQRNLNKLANKLTRLLEAKKASSHLSIEERSRIDSEYEQSIDNIQTTKKELEQWCLQEKIVNRRTLKIIQILCQLTVNNGLDDETITWAANFIIMHIKDKDTENMDICLSCIVDILLFDKDLSGSFLKIYQSLINTSGVHPDNFNEDNPQAAQIVTIIKACYDMFCILDNFGLDIFEDHSLKISESGELVDAGVKENDKI